jgi:hypothetical protein
VDQSAEYSVTSDWGIGGNHGGRIVGRRVLVKSLVRPVVIEMAHVLVEHSVGVSFVVDQHPVGAFSADAADESFRVAVRPRRPRRDLDRILTTSMPSEAKTASKVAVNLVSRSRIRRKRRDKPAWRRRWKSSTSKG